MTNGIIIGTSLEELLRRTQDIDYFGDAEEDLEQIAALVSGIMPTEELKEWFWQEVMPQNPVLAMMVAMKCLSDEALLEDMIKKGLSVAGGSQINFWSRSSIETIGVMKTLPIFAETFRDKPQWLKLSFYYLNCRIPKDDLQGRDYLRHLFPDVKTAPVK